MPKTKNPFGARRILQGAFLAAFLALLFYFAAPRSSESQLTFERTDQWAPVFLLGLIDPLASLAAFLADRALSILIVVPLLIVAICLVFPRVFCSHVCPLGTLIDAVGLLRRKRRASSFATLKLLKYALLAAASLVAVFGLGLAGFVTPMPMLARGCLAALNAWQWPPDFDALWLAVLVAVLLLSLVRRRFWCNTLCPSGALLSLVSRLSFRKRVRSNACVKCGLCVTVCDFDALGEGDFHAAAECAWCGRCAEVCRTDAVSYAATKERAEFSPTRRDLLAGAGLTAGFLALGVPFGMKSDRPRLRPPGSLPGDDFLARCIRCGLCARVCPGPAISLVGRDGGLATCGTPEIVAERAGCSPACRNCGRVCPTGAIEDLPLDVKNRVIIGTADHLRDLCLPWQRMEKCGPCVDICREAGFNAIEWVRRPAPDEARPTEESDEPDDFEWVPRVNPAKCVGCGLCVQICMQKFVTDSGILPEPAIAVTPKRVQERVDPTLRT